MWISNGLDEALLGASEGRGSFAFRFLEGGVDWGSSAENNPAIIDMRMPDEVILIGVRIFIAYCNCNYLLL